MCEHRGSFGVPNQYETALREHWWSVLAESPLFAVITITITAGHLVQPAPVNWHVASEPRGYLSQMLLVAACMLGLNGSDK